MTTTDTGLRHLNPEDQARRELLLDRLAHRRRPHPNRTRRRGTVPHPVSEVITCEPAADDVPMHRRRYTTPPPLPPLSEGAEPIKQPPVLHPACQPMQDPPRQLYGYSTAWAQSKGCYPCPEPACYPGEQPT